MSRTRTRRGVGRHAVHLLQQYSKEGYINAGPDTNYNDLINSMEFWNIVTLKQETNNYTANIYESLIDAIERIIDLLENELKTTP